MFKAKPLTVPYVFSNLTEIAKATGNSVRQALKYADNADGAQSQQKKVGIINKLLAACQGNEAKFIVRSLEGKLRIGLAEKTLVLALAHAIVLKSLGDSTCVVVSNRPDRQGRRRFNQINSQLL